VIAALKAISCISRLRSSNDVFIFQANDSNAYVFNTYSNAESNLSRIIEFIVNKSCYELGWKVKEPVLLEIDDDFDYKNCPDSFKDSFSSYKGFNLALKYVNNAKEISIPGNYFLSLDSGKQMLAIDAFFMNPDRTPSISKFLYMGNQDYVLLNHNRCLFLSDYSETNLALSDRHLFRKYSLSQAEKQLKQLAEFDFKGLVKLIPESWLTQANLTETDLHKKINKRKEITHNWLDAVNITL